MILRDLIGDTDFGDLPDDLSDFVYYWQGMTNLRARPGRLGLGALRARSAAAATTSSRRCTSPRSACCTPASDEAQGGGGDLLRPPLRRHSTWAPPSRRCAAAARRDSKLAYAIKALINEDNAINVQLRQPAQGLGESSSPCSGLARVAAETESPAQARQGDRRGGARPAPRLRRADRRNARSTAGRSRFEERGPAIKAVAARCRRGAHDQRPGAALPGAAAVRAEALRRRLRDPGRDPAEHRARLGDPARARLVQVQGRRPTPRHGAALRPGRPGLPQALRAGEVRPARADLPPLLSLPRGQARGARASARSTATPLREIRAGPRPARGSNACAQPALRRVQSRKLFLFLRSLLRRERDSHGATTRRVAAGRAAARTCAQLYRQQAQADQGGAQARRWRSRPARWPRRCSRPRSRSTCSSTRWARRSSSG